MFQVEAQLKKSGKMNGQQKTTFLYFGDKNVSKVSGIWKALHISIYIAAAIISFITSMAAGNLFQTFKYNCILFCTDIEFQKEVMPAEMFLMRTVVSPDLSPSQPDEIMLEGNNTILEGIDAQNLTIDEASNDTSALNINDITSSNKPDIDLDATMKENGTIIFKNETNILQNEGQSTIMVYAKIDMRRSLFPSNFWCNFVLGIALVSFIFTTFCVVMLAMCSKGGKGRNNTLNRPQNMIYPIIVTSILLGVLNLLASIVVKKGMNGFCANFEIFTGGKSCSSLINKFTLHERQENFYLPYVVLSHTLNLTVILFLAQIVVAFVRVIYAVDYQLYTMKVEDNEEEHVLEVDDGHIVQEGKM